MIEKIGKDGNGLLSDPCRDFLTLVKCKKEDKKRLLWQRLA